MRRLEWPRWEVAALLAITVVGAVLRFAGYGDAPLFTDNADEIQFSWAGLNLLAHGDAYTWSYFPAYPQPPDVLQAFGTAFPMVHHWMDHPPGFSLLMGAWLWVTGPHDMLTLTPERVRVLPVLFATSTIPLGYVAVRRALGTGAALFGAVLLATSPGAVLISRQAEPESLLAPLLLSASLLADHLGRPEERRDRRYANTSQKPLVAGLLLVAAVSPTLKITGLAVGGIAATILLVHGRYRLAAAVAAATAAGGLVYPLYGWLVDWHLFLAVVHEQSLNRIGMMSGYQFITAPAGINRPLHDGWWLLGWIAVGSLLVYGRRSRAELLLAWPALAYALVIMLLAGEELTSRYGWYRLILMPQVLFAAGALAWRGVATPSLGRLAAVLLLGGATATNWWFAKPGAESVVNPVLGAVLIALVLGPAALTATPRFAQHRSVAQGLAGAAMGIIVLGNIAETLMLPAIFGHL
jgi:hypothetical protein